MKKLYLLGVSLFAGVVLTGVFSVTAFAWHPEGKIKKYVQNQTSGSMLGDADTSDDAISAHPGDVLKYVIEVSNTGKQASNGWNDMHYTQLKDMLPAGVELVGDADKSVITENLGILKPGESVTKEYLVRVTSTVDQDVITNKACFTGDSEVRDNKQSGCDEAVVVVTVPEEPEEPEVPQEEPKEPVKQEPAPASPEAEVLPATGAGSVFGLLASATGVGYTAHRLVLRRK